MEDDNINNTTLPVLILENGPTCKKHLLWQALTPHHFKYPTTCVGKQDVFANFAVFQLL